MREIKFRAWDNQRKKFFTDSKWVEFTIDNNGNLKAKNYTIGHKGYQSLEINQYTGLKDKNGVEIYEGDIVEFRIRILGDRYEKSVCKVSFIDGSYMITKDKELRLWNMNCEVIGNIYENPELLKEGI